MVGVGETPVLADLPALVQALIAAGPEESASIGVQKIGFLLSAYAGRDESKAEVLGPLEPLSSPSNVGILESFPDLETAIVTYLASLEHLEVDVPLAWAGMLPVSSPTALSLLKQLMRLDEAKARDPETLARFSQRDWVLAGLLARRAGKAMSPKDAADLADAALQYAGERREALRI